MSENGSTHTSPSKEAANPIEEDPLAPPPYPVPDVSEIEIQLTQISLTMEMLQNTIAQVLSKVSNVECRLDKVEKVLTDFVAKANATPPASHPPTNSIPSLFSPNFSSPLFLNPNAHSGQAMSLFANNALAQIPASQPTPEQNTSRKRTHNDDVPPTAAHLKLHKDRPCLFCSSINHKARMCLNKSRSSRMRIMKDRNVCYKCTRDLPFPNHKTLCLTSKCTRCHRPGHCALICPSDRSLTW